MALTNKIEKKPEYIQMIFEGDSETSFTNEALIKQIIEVYVAHKAIKILVDLGKVTGDRTTTQRFELGVLAADKYHEIQSKLNLPNCSFAAVGNEPVVDPNRFTETVAVNRGLNVKVFTEMDKAIRWLAAQSTE